MKVRLQVFLTSLFILFFSGVVAAFAQGKIKGTVVDDEGEAIIGATVVIKGTTNGAATDIDGNYVISNLADGTYTLTVSFIGYQTLEKAITISGGNTVTADFQLGVDLLNLDEIVITGLVNPKTKLESSVSITSVQPDFLQEFGAQTTAETFKTIPGIRSESSGGEGNANIAVRGVPIASGGSKFLQLHEDGLPVMQFGDISFGNADIFLRADQTIDRIEAIRGGSASTLASNSPAGVINFISKTGAQEGGSVSSTFGIDYKSLRTDFEYGSPISESVRFHIGGFFRQGEGPRNPGYTANFGGQVKANITKEFKQGYARLYFKYLNDKSIGYLPMPIQVSGTDSDPEVSAVPGFDAENGTIHSPQFLHILGVDGSGNSRTSNVANGMRPLSTAIGGEFSFELADEWVIDNKFRMAFNSGSFNSPFPAQVASADEIASSIAGANYTLSYATGANAGVALSDTEIANLNGNGLLMRIHSFDTEIDNLNNFSNNFQLTKTFNDQVHVTLGYYKAYQRIGMTWLWQTFITDVNSDNTRLIDITDNSGTALSENGLTAHGVPFWGNCCTRSYDMRYAIDAVYANVGVDITDDLNVEASIRYDQGAAFGHYLNNTQAAVDVNRDGTISSVEQSVTVLDNGNPNTVDYDFDYISYSIGANYKLTNNAAVFARYSQGGRANADRLLYTAFLTSAGQTIDGLDSDQINQLEVGVKLRNDIGGLFVTGFYSGVDEQNEEFGQAISREYTSFGAELEGVIELEGFNLRAGFTYSNSEISNDQLNPDLEGNTPRRVPDLLFNVSPSYRFNKKFALGFSMIGNSKVYAQDNNELALPGFAYFNAFARATITEGLSLRLNVNNLTNTLGLTEAEEGALSPITTAPLGTTNVIRARPITGRATSLTLSYNF
ncbi:MAG: TonB-dependent receptor [Flammeovirgaceae bacterium]